MRTLALRCVAIVLCGSFVGAGPAASEDAGGNAALRYWMAFAMMENPPADGAVAKKLDAVSEGTSPWDDSLAAIVDRNVEALSTMHRGTRLASCDWGLEPEMRESAPIAHVSRARAMARLNVLLGLRRLHQGKASDAADAWLAGVRFSRDVSDGPLVATLVASLALRAHLVVLRQAVVEKRFDAATLRRVEQAVAALPESGFDWGKGVGYEVGGYPMIAEALEREPDPLAVLMSLMFDTTTDRAALKTPDRAAAAQALGVPEAQLATRESVLALLRRSGARYKELGPQYVAAIRGPYEGSAPRFREIDARATEDPILSKVWASAARCNERRGDVVKARAELLAALRAR